MYNNFDSLGALNLASLLKTGTDTYSSIRTAKDGRAIAQANSAAAIAASNAEAARWAAQARQGAGSNTEIAKIVGYVAVAGILAFVAVKAKRRYSRR